MVALIAVFSGAFTCGVVEYTLRRTQLPLLPADDARYFAEGAQRLVDLSKHGFRNFVFQLFTDPPHSPFSTALAMLCFKIFGFKDWAPFLGNGILVFTFLLTSNWLLFKVPAPARVLWLLFVLTLPLCATCVHEFRPDAAAALLTAAGVAGFFLFPEKKLEEWHFIKVGLCFAAALVAKPSTFPLTLLLLISSSALAWVSERRSARYYVLCFSAALLPALPYYLVGGSAQVHYIIDDIFSPYTWLWAAPPGMWNRVTYYLSGEGAAYAFGRHVYILGALISVGFYLKFRERNHWQRRWLCFGAVTCIAYLIPTWNTIKGPFLGQIFQFMVVFLALACGARVGQGKMRVAVAGALFAIGLVAAIPLNVAQQTVTAPAADRERVILLQRAALRVLHAQDTKTESVIESNRVYVAAEGAMGHATFWWLDYQAGHRFNMYHDYFFLGTTPVDEWQVMWGHIERMNFVVVGDTDALGSFSASPAAKLGDRAVKTLKSDPRFTMLAALSDGHNRQYYIFKNTAPLPRR